MLVSLSADFSGSLLEYRLKWNWHLWRSHIFNYYRRFLYLQNSTFH